MDIGQLLLLNIPLKYMFHYFFFLKNRIASYTEHSGSINYGCDMLYLIGQIDTTVF